MPIRPWGVQVVASESGTGTRQQHDLRRPARGPDLREPRDADRPVADARAHADRAGAGRRTPIRATNCDRELERDRGGSGRRPTRRPIAPPICWRRRRRSSICATARATAAPEAAAADRADSGPGRRADRRAEPGRRLAVGQRRSPAPRRVRTNRPRGERPARPRRRSSGRWPRPSRSGS